MTRENEQQMEQKQKRDAQENYRYEAYGWEFHKKPLIYALVLTILFYLFIFFYINV